MLARVSLTAKDISRRRLSSFRRHRRRSRRHVIFDQFLSETPRRIASYPCQERRIIILTRCDDLFILPFSASFLAEIASKLLVKSGLRYLIFLIICATRRHPSRLPKKSIPEGSTSSADRALCCTTTYDCSESHCCRSALSHMDIKITKFTRNLVSTTMIIDTIFNTETGFRSLRCNSHFRMILRPKFL